VKKPYEYLHNDPTKLTENVDPRDVEDRQQVRSFVESSTWLDVIKPALEYRLNLVERQLAVNTQIDLETVKFKQGQHSVLRRIIDEPVDSLTVSSKERGVDKS
jgi:hypothetical protein